MKTGSVFTKIVRGRIQILHGQADGIFKRINHGHPHLGHPFQAKAIVNSHHHITSFGNFLEGLDHHGFIAAAANKASTKNIHKAWKTRIWRCDFWHIYIQQQMVGILHRKLLSIIRLSEYGERK